MSSDAPPPAGWAEVSLGDICASVEQVDPRARFDGSFTYLEISSIDRSTNRLVEPTEVPAQSPPSRARQVVAEGDTLFSTVRTNLRNIAIVDGRFANQIASTGFCVLRPHPPIECRYIYYYTLTNAFVETVSGLQRGVSYPAVREADIRAQHIPLAPTNEQRRIVDKIDQLFSLIEAGERALERARRLLERYRQSVLKAAVSGVVTRDWRERHQGEIEPGEALLARILKARRKAWEANGHASGSLPVTRSLDRDHCWDVPSTWRWCSIDEAGDVQLGQQRAPQHHAGAYMRPYLRVANVLDDELDLSDVKWMNFEPGELKKFELRTGDVLLNEGQSPDKLGRSAIYRGEIGGCCIQKTLLRFRAYDGVLPKFAQIVFRHYMYSGRFRRIARITTNIGHITRVRFAAMEFPLPPEKEQTEIVDRVQAAEANLRHLARDMSPSAAEALRQSIISAAFSGKLVSQDPSDEPASALVARLRGDRSGTRTLVLGRGRPARVAV